jgi:hypothetical protein
LGCLKISHPSQYQEISEDFASHDFP